MMEPSKATCSGRQSVGAELRQTIRVRAIMAGLLCRSSGHGEGVAVAISCDRFMPLRAFIPHPGSGARLGARRTPTSNLASMLHCTMPEISACGLIRQSVARVLHLIRSQQPQPTTTRP
ncbi:hypothetical protein SI859A1_00404 [Aurantimonas manganoxydans SI85-9A1]|uniref:Uncharacterized protein n=1 Tax=Aurantimonas manganoxydans (strain ATCC BAA-1229 / DSM 21871 / SI85-9A1) TaxID=287752 RepID=Q1YH35_AURMS|nr:hypothetical protein SI859A1_00404 [Aurantimonas manganoxydans SI85-9A1]